MKVDNGSGVFGVYMGEGVFGVNDDYERYQVDCVEGGGVLSSVFWTSY